MAGHQRRPGERYLAIVKIRRGVAALALIVMATACGRSGVSRSDVVESYRRELVDQGVREDQARCLTDRFFAELTDAELRGFQQRDGLTEAESRRFTELAEVCADPTGATTTVG